MSLDILADLEAGKRPHGPVCDVVRLREARPDLAEQYDRAMADGRFSDSDIARWIEANGGHLGKHTIMRHRLNECVGCRTS